MKSEPNLALATWQGSTPPSTRGHRNRGVPPNRRTTTTTLKRATTMTGNEALLRGRWSDAALTDRLLRVNIEAPSWFGLALTLSALGALIFFGAALYTLTTGIGVWGNNIPVAWGFAITNFVWWIGIGHAGTFISAVLLLFEQRFRTALNRIAESMTLFALVQAGMFPLLHMGRAWF